MLFGDKILVYRDEILKDLATLLEIESVDGERNEECERALAFIIKRAQDFGLDYKMVTDKSVHVQLGDGGKLCGVLAHVDVVPAGNNWSVIPYALTERDGRLYGRGIADDKGAALLNLYCLRVLKENGVQGKNTLRAIFGSAEETGMRDMQGYFEKMPLPDMAFTPDSDYGICFAEKGILHLRVSTPTNEAKVLSQFHAGKAVNAVPHACEPEKGKNAAALLIDLITHAYDLHEIGALASFIHYALNCETNGRSLGLKMSDGVSGPLTVNLGVIHIEGHTAEAYFDIRYPVTVSGEKIIAQFRAVAEYNGMQVEVVHHDKPLYLEKDSPLIRELSAAYESVTGEKPTLYATGGGTYARKLGGRGVAFGPHFAGDPINMHNADESMDKENFFLHAQICLEALYRLYNVE